MGNLGQPIISTLKFSDFIMSLATSDVQDEVGRERARTTEGPSIAWILGHLIHHRCEMLGLLGQEHSDRFASLFASKGASDGRDYPEMSELRAAWTDLSSRVVAALEAASDRELESRPGGESPHAEKTVLEALAFLSWHEPYHLGQLGTLRAQLGLTPIATLAVEAATL